MIDLVDFCGNLAGFIALAAFVAGVFASAQPVRLVQQRFA